MIPFYIVFVAVYGTLHAYIHWKIRQAWLIRTDIQVILAVVFAVMVMAPLLVRAAETSGWDDLAHGIAYAGYVWFGLVLLFVVTSGALDGYQGILRLAAALTGWNPEGFRIAARNGFIVSLLVAVGVNAYGYWEAWNIRTERIVLRSALLPADAKPFRIVQISDVHLGMMVGKKRMAAILAHVRAAQPDILVSTGDLVDGQPDSIQDALDLLKDLHPPLGKFAVTGNHEYYAGLEKSLVFMERAGFRILRGEAVSVANLLYVAGVDDREQVRFSGIASAAEHAVLSALPRDRFTVLLKHRPEVARDAVDLFDLQLSGHTHRGQIFPFSVIISLYSPYHAGLYTLGRRSRLYVNRGSGFWGPPVRFLAPPEVTVIDVESSAAAG